MIKNFFFPNALTERKSTFLQTALISLLFVLVAGSSGAQITSPSCSTVVNVSAGVASLCAGGSGTTLTASGTANSYSWMPSTGLSATTGTSVTANPSVTTTYTVTGTPTVSATFNYLASIQTYTVPAGITSLTITANGAQGGGNEFNIGGLGGHGAIMSGVFSVVPGQVLKIITGGQGQWTGFSNAGAGGGGTFVWDNATSTPLIAAGGGGGVGYSGSGTATAGGDASTSTSGTNGTSASSGGGTAGNGATAPSGYTAYGSGGTGWFSNGNNGSVFSCAISSTGGSTPLSGGAGGAGGGTNSPYTYTQNGGFGGGGGNNGNCGPYYGGAGGGGGYSGGGAGGTVGSTIIYSGGGGGSYNAGTSQSNSTGSTGNGIVTIVGSGCSNVAMQTISVNPTPAAVFMQGIITTIAGTGSTGFGSDGPATAVNMYGPSAVHTDAYGNVYIVDLGRVRRINTSGILTTLAGTLSGGATTDGGPATAAFLNNVWDVVADASGNIYIAEASTNKIRKVNTSGIISTYAGTGTAGYTGDGGAATSATLSAPTGVAIDAAGNVYVADLFNGTIRKITPAGTISTVAGNGSNSYSGDGGPATNAGMSSPYRVAVDASGNLYITDYGNSRIRKVNTAGIISTIAGTGTSGFTGDGGAATAAQISGPMGIDVDNSGNVYIADQGNNRIRRIEPNGFISTVSGDGTAAYNGDGGAANTAQINAPQAVAVSATGDVYVADQGNHRVRKIDLSAKVCPGASVTMTSATTGGIWSSSNTSLATVGSAAGVVTGVAAGNAAITYALAGGCNSVKQLTVNPLPTAITGITTVYTTGITTLNSTPAGGSWASSNTSVVTIGAATGVMTGVGIGTSTVSYTIASGCLITATATDTAAPAAGALNFDGINDQVSMATSVTEMAYGSFTIEAWVKTTGSGMSIVTVSNLNTSWEPGEKSFYIDQTTGNPVFVGYNNGYIPGDIAVNDGAWHHVAVTWDYPSGVGKMYVDGVDHSSGVGYYPNDANSGTLQIGRPNFGENVNYFNGSLDEVRIWNRALCAGEIVNSMNCELGSGASGLMAYYKFNQGFTGADNSAITTVTDNSGNGNDGTMQNFASTGTASNWVTGNITGSCATWSTIVASITAGGPLTFCAGGSVVLSANSGTGYTYQWTLEGANISGATDQTYTAVATGNYAVVVTPTVSCPSTSSATYVNVLPTSAAAIAGPTAVGIGSNITLTNSAAGGTWSTASANVTVSSTGVVSGVSAGTAVVTYVLSNVCGTSQATTTINVLINACVPAYYYAYYSCVYYGLFIYDFGIDGSGGYSMTDNGTGCDGTGYQDRRGIAADVMISAGASYTATITVGPYYQQNVAAWIDFNDDGNFTSDEMVGGIDFILNTATFTITIPTGAAGGSHNMRVRSGYYGSTPTFTSMDACSDYTYGEAHDYTAVLAISGNTSICVGGSSTLTDVLVPGGTWSSSNTAVVTIGSATGTMTGVSPGVSTISYGSGSSYATVEVTVNAFLTVGAITGNTTLTTAISTQLNAVASLGTGMWTSANASIATVGSGSGLVSGMAAGTSIISYTVSHAGCSTAVVTTSVTVMAPQPSLNFDGADDYVHVVNGYTATNDITYEVWARADAFSGLSSVIMADYWDPGKIHFQFAGSGIGFSVNGSSPTDINSSYSFDPGQWYHIAAVYSATNSYLKFYVNGVMTDSVQYAYAMPIAGGNAFSIGSWFNGYVDRPFAGNIDEVRIWNVARTTAQIQSNMNCDVAQQAGLMAYYRFNQGTPGGDNTSLPVAFDYSGNGNCGQLTNMALNGTASNYVTGAVGTCSPITVTPVNAGTITGASSVAMTATITLTDAVAGGVWSAGNSNATVSSTGDVTGVNPGTVTISYTVTNSCGTAAATKVVTVNFAITTGSTGSLVVCTGNTTTLANPTTGGLWNSGNTSVATINASNGIVTGISTGTAAMTYTLMGSSVVSVVTVNLSPVSITGATKVCYGLTATVIDSTTGGTWTSSNTGIATVDAASGLVSGAGVGNATISYTSPNGCYKTMTMTVNPLPVAISGASGVCVGGYAVLTDASSVGMSWTSSNPSVATIGSASGVVIGVTTGTTLITYMLNTGCQITTPIAVNPAPSVVTGGSPLCPGTQLTLSATPSGGAWSSSVTGVATVGSTGVVTGLAAGATTITYDLGAGCVSITNITVNPLPSSITGAQGICAGSTSALNSTTSGGTWSSDATSVATVGASGSTGIVTGLTSGNANIYYTMPTGCLRSVEVTVSVLSAITGPTGICVGMPVALSHPTSGGSWTSSNTAVATIGASTGIVSGVTAGTASITYTISGGCRAIATITVNAAMTNITGPASVCQGATITLANATAGGAWSATGAVSVDATGIVTGLTTGSGVITYTATTGCYKTATVNVQAPPAAIAGTKTVCAGATTTLTDPTSGGLSWTTSTPSVATINSSGIVTGVASGTSTITYTVTSGCRATAIVTVNTTPGTITGGTSVCVGNTVALSSATTGGTWSSSVAAAGSVGSTSGVVTGLASGVTIITYTAGGCSKVSALTVNPIPSSITGAAGICLGSSVTFGSTPSSGTWSSSAPGVATITTAGVASAVTSGNSTISYTLASGCARAVVVTVSPAPAILGTTVICTGNTVALTCSTTGGTWTSGTTAVGTIGATTGAFTGMTAGTTNVTYTISAVCKSTTTATVNAGPATISGPAGVCAGSTGTLTDATMGGAWSSSNTAVGTINASTGVIAALTTGTTIISYTTSTGCSQTKTITVGGGLGAVTGSGGLCTGGTTTLIPPTTGLSWTSSNVSVATVGVSSGLVTGVAAGTATITFTPYDFGSYAGCVALKVVTVDVTPSVAAIGGVSSVAVGHTVTLTDATAGGTWSSNTTSKATVSSTGVVTGVSAGAATISYAVTNGACQVAATKGITITSSRPGLSIDQQASFVLYPNPTSGAFSVMTSAPGMFVVYTIEGKEVQRNMLSEGLNALHLSSNLAAGIYMCKYSGDDGSTVMVRLVYGQ